MCKAKVQRPALSRPVLSRPVPSGLSSVTSFSSLLNRRNLRHRRVKGERERESLGGKKRRKKREKRGEKIGKEIRPSSIELTTCAAAPHRHDISHYRVNEYVLKSEKHGIIDILIRRNFIELLADVRLAATLKFNFLLIIACIFEERNKRLDAGR